MNRHHDNMGGMSPKQADLDGKNPQSFRLRMPEALYEVINNKAHSRGLSINALLLEMLEAALAKETVKKPKK